MKTSVIIPSFNPTIKLPETLKKLVSQSKFIDELIIIVDNDNYTDIAKSIVKEYLTDLKIKLSVRPNSGRAISRNKGVELSSGELIIFLDDDMLAEKDLIEKHIQYHIENPNTIISGNGYRNPECATYDFGKFLIIIEKKWKMKGPDSGEITLKKFSFTASNLSLPRSIFEQLGGFDIRLSDCEDFDFAIRALNKDLRIIYDNKLLAWHNDWPEINAYIKRQNEYTSAKMELLKVHPEYLSYFPNLMAKEGNKIKKLTSVIIRATLGKWVIAKNRIFETLPVKLKFRLYQIAISANANINR